MLMKQKSQMYGTDIRYHLKTGYYHHLKKIGKGNGANRSRSIRDEVHRANIDIFVEGTKIDDISPADSLITIDFLAPHSAQRHETIFHQYLWHHIDFFTKVIPVSLKPFAGSEECYLYNKHVDPYLLNFKHDTENWKITDDNFRMMIPNLQSLFINQVCVIKQSDPNRPFTFINDANLFYICVHKDDFITPVDRLPVQKQTTDIKKGTVLYNNHDSFNIVDMVVNDKPVCMFRQNYNNNRSKDRYWIPVDFFSIYCNSTSTWEMPRDVVNRNDLCLKLLTKADDEKQKKENKQLTMLDELEQSNAKVDLPVVKDGYRVRSEDCIHAIPYSKINAFKEVLAQPTMLRTNVLSALKHINSIKPLKDIYLGLGIDPEYFNKNVLNMMCFNKMGQEPENFIPFDIENLENNVLTTLDKDYVYYHRIKADHKDNDIVLMLFQSRAITISADDKIDNEDLSNIYSSAYIIGISGPMFDFLKWFGLTKLMLTNSFYSIYGNGRLVTRKYQVSKLKDGKRVRDIYFPSNVDILELLLPKTATHLPQLTRGQFLITPETLRLEERNSDMYNMRCAHNTYTTINFSIAKKDRKANMRTIVDKFNELIQLDVSVVIDELKNGAYLRDILLTDQDTWKFQALSQSMSDKKELLSVGRFTFSKTNNYAYKYTVVENFKKKFFAMNVVDKPVPAPVKDIKPVPVPEMDEEIIDTPEPEVSEKPIEEKEIVKMSDNILKDAMIKVMFGQGFNTVDNSGEIKLDETRVEVEKDGDSMYEVVIGWKPVCRIVDKTSDDEEDYTEQVITEEQVHKFLGMVKGNK